MHADLRKRLVTGFRWLDPGPHSTHLVSDMSGWWHDPEILAGIGPALAALFPTDRPTVVVSPEATGYLVGPLVATAVGAGFVPAVKQAAGRQVAEPVTWAHTPPDYRDRTLRLGVRDRHLGPADRMLVVDDWVATGAQVRAIYEIAARRGATIVGTAAIVADCPGEIARDLGLRTLLQAHHLAA
ncbi:phosphoribosyltransferase family protein [Polymorphospora rubra]|uniref:Adenine phosphoribosyltransferase n=1 Tax=Polymorphospora rubra TaxID=338584 RepID=A0A810N0T1_9ACTN|nr:phosphoribosyltransferase family protein [Polymorphospora rubra]BCJ65393.1 adenine phosphoribosyltransferase [Polymorphospora rubra]